MRLSPDDDAEENEQAAADEFGGVYHGLQGGGGQGM